jgi:hypothetical protein
MSTMLENIGNLETFFDYCNMHRYSMNSPAIYSTWTDSPPHPLYLPARDPLQIEANSAMIRLPRVFISSVYLFHDAIRIICERRVKSQERGRKVSLTPFSVNELT